jgi:hypothetical protein
MPPCTLYLALATLSVSVCDVEYYKDVLKKTNGLIGNRDPDDIHLLALALKLSWPIWSNDRDFADLSQYLLIDKSGLNTQVSIHIRSLYDETAFRYTYRVDGESVRKNSLTKYKGSLPVSPFLCIEAR